MTLYIHDRCWEQMLDLPRQIGKKVIEFQKKFRENPYHPSLNFEYIHDFRDQNMRTARIDQRYRAIVAGPLNEEDFYLLWVDNHDEAMDWARDKVFQWNESTKAFQIFRAPMVEVATANPLETGVQRLFDPWDDALLGRLGVPEMLLPLVRKIQDLDGLGAVESDLPADVFEYLFKLADGVAPESLIEEIEEGRRVLGTDGQSANNRRHYVEVSDDLIKGVINGDMEKWRVFLHPSQRILVESDFKGSFKLSGGAGTGKTVVALHRFRHLSEQATGSSRGKVVFTTFTLQLTDHLSNLAQRIGVDESRGKILNVDALARELGTRLGVLKEKSVILDVVKFQRSVDVWNQLTQERSDAWDADFLNREYQEVVLQQDITDLQGYLVAGRTGMDTALSRRQRMEIWTLMEAYAAYKTSKNMIDRGELFNRVAAAIRSSGDHPYRHVIADEVQDLSNVELRFLRSLVPEGENDLFLVGDPFQRIYARKMNFGAVGISVRGKRSRQLRINYRTSEEIKRAAVSTVQSLKPDDFDGDTASLSGYLSVFHGERPTYSLYRTKSEEVSALLDAIRLHHQDGVPYSAIAVGVRIKRSMDPFRDALHRVGIPYNDRVEDKRRDKTGVLLSTLHGLKGLEFKVVFLVDVTDATCPVRIHGYDTMPEIKRREHLQAERALLYVAMSRAISVLTITGTGQASGLVQV